MHHTSDRALVAGVCLRLARRMGVDALWLRLAFVGATVAGGFGIPLYLVAWILLPGEDGRSPRTGRSAFEVGAGAGLLVDADIGLGHLDVRKTDPRDDSERFRDDRPGDRRWDDWDDWQDTDRGSNTACAT